MPNEPKPFDPGNLWREQETENMTITIDEIRQRATRFERRIQWRNIREYGAGVFILAVVLPRLRTEHGWHLVPPLLMIAGALVVMVNLWLISAKPVPQDAGRAACLEFHRRELEKQRDALRRVWLWYLLPLVPGILAVFVMGAIDRGRVEAPLIISAVIGVLVFGGVWWLNIVAANKLDRKIDEIARLEQ